MTSDNATTTKMIKIDRFFTKENQTSEDVFNAITWVQKKSTIKDKSGNILYDEDVVFPDFWNDNSINIVSSKYFYRGPTKETHLKQLIERVVERICEWLCNRYEITGKSKNVVAFKAELTYILLHQLATFNSPVWFNLGLDDRKQIASACFLSDIGDDLNSILDFAKTEGLIFKYGAGNGCNYSSLRGSCEQTKGGGKASGPISFMRIFDEVANTVRSGGILRRAAKMAVLDVDHPDILNFIDMKNIEEKKAKALIKMGYDSSIDGEAYRSVKFQNQNNSVRITDEFMHAAINDKEYRLNFVHDKNKKEKLKAKEVLMKIATSAHETGDPGLQFKNTINEFNAVPNNGEIRVSNPCGEVYNIDNTACNLGSINISKIYDGRLNLDMLKHIVRIMVIAQDAIVDYADYPVNKIAKGVKNTRNIGLGITNLGTLLIRMCVPYASEEGRAISAGFMSVIMSEAYKTSNEIARKIGPFPFFADNRETIENLIHAYADNMRDIYELLYGYKHLDLEEAVVSARKTMIELSSIMLEENGGLANCYLMAQAPVGTVSFMLGADTTGIEPMLSLRQVKNLVGGTTMYLANPSVVESLVRLGYEDNQISDIENYIAENNTVVGSPHLDKKHYNIYKTSIGSKDEIIHYHDHILMSSILQKVIDMGISKTINMPNDVTPEDIFNAYIYAWENGMKGITVYRDGSKAVQPLSKEKKEKSLTRGERKKLPNERQGLIHKFSIGGHEGYIIIGLYPDDNSPGEIFILMAQVGTFTSGMIDKLATTCSLGLQYGVPLEHIVRKFKGSKFEPRGRTDHEDIQIAQSVVDYIGQYLELKFGDSNGYKDRLVVLDLSNSETGESTGETCQTCGSEMVKIGSCFYCMNCYENTGCS